MSTIARIAANALGNGERNISGRLLEAQMEVYRRNNPDRIDDVSVVTMRR